MKGDTRSLGSRPSPRDGTPGNYVAGINIDGCIRVADAMLAPGMI